MAAVAAGAKEASDQDMGAGAEEAPDQTLVVGAKEALEGSESSWPSVGTKEALEGGESPSPSLWVVSMLVGGCVLRAPFAGTSCGLTSNAERAASV